MTLGGCRGTGFAGPRTRRAWCGFQGLIFLPQLKIMHITFLFLQYYYFSSGFVSSSTAASST